MTLYVLCPVYNEELNLKELSKSLISELKDYKTKFIFVDDGSRDNTLALINQFFCESDYIVLGDGENHGPGFAFNTGFEWILANSSSNDDIVLTLEADNTSDLNIFPIMIANLKHDYDLVLSSVNAQGGGFDNTNFLRKFYSLVANMILRFVFDIKVLTLGSFYRLYKISLLQKIKKKYGYIIVEKGFISMIEVLLKAIKLNSKIIEIPMVLKSEKRKGKSKMKITKTILTYVRFLFFNKL